MSKTCRVPMWLFVLILSVMVRSTYVYGQFQDRRFGVRRGGEITYEPRGPGVLFDALDPAVKRWYVPQELYVDYGWQQWEYSNYARDHYQRYVDITLEGEPFYDLYGNYLTRGWLIFDWNQNQPRQFGSSIYKDPRFNSWFNAVTISSDSKGQFYYAMTVGDRIRTTLTPLTFSKPAFNGVQLDFASDKYAGTVLLSRINQPIVGATLGREPNVSTNATNMMAARATVQVGDFMKIGATLVNAHNTQTLLDAFDHNPFIGTLGVNQGSTPITGIALVLSDDSPEDGKGGAALFSHDIVITAEVSSGKREDFRLRDVVADPTKWPVVIGGVPREGFLSADGPEKIVINYDFTDVSYIGPRPTEIVKVTFDLVLANDYKIQIWSDRQTGQRPVPKLPLTGRDLEELKPVLFDILRAEGNIADNSNQTRVVFEYGLPSANMTYGFTLEAKNLMGFDAYAEFDTNCLFFQYPSPGLSQAGRSLHTYSKKARAWMLNVSKVAYPFYLFFEAFGMEPGYSTSTFIVNEAGDVIYDDPTRALYEFVEDNDDQDRIPDWFRYNQGGPDTIVLPGWDENNDFVSDFNQNDTRTLSNRIPDYEEPFFRYNVDRPEFLFGIDLNNNNWIDRFENDDLPDYPYKRDHRGYNVYIGGYLMPEMRLTVGRLREQLISSDRRNHTTYGLFTFDHDSPRIGRLRIFDMVKRVKDNVRDDRREPTPYLKAISLANIEDILPARDTWVNSAYVRSDYRLVKGLRVINKLKYDLFEQQGQAFKGGDGPVLNTSTHFLGVINKFDYTYRIADLIFQPKFKSEFLTRTPFLREGSDRKEWTGTWTLLMKHPLLHKSLIEGGMEFTLFKDLVLNEDKVLNNGPAQATGDFRNLVLAIQWTTVGEYLGYKLTTQFGLSFTKRWNETIKLGDTRLVKTNETEASGTSFVIVYAGVGK